MNRHPGGEEQTIHLLKSIELKKGMKALDLGAGEGETVRIMKAFGLNVQGVDLAPRSSEVQQGDFLTLQYAADSMDLCISQCAFFVSRDQKKAVSECWRVLKKGGFLLLSDLDPGNLLENRLFFRLILCPYRTAPNSTDGFSGRPSGRRGGFNPLRIRAKPPRPSAPAAHNAPAPPAA